MTVFAIIVNFVIRGFFRLICRIEDSELARIPSRGPLILIGNHINFLDAPILLTHLQPRPVMVLAKYETWHNPILGRLFDIWKSIPIRRGELDMAAFRQSLRCLEEGNILALAPEGTRSGDGRLQKGQPGIVLLAMKSNVPILPVAFYGGEHFWRNIKRLRRTSLYIRVGQPFSLSNIPAAPSKEEREKITDEIMYKLAALLPDSYRGKYSDTDLATTHYLNTQIQVLD